MYTFRFDVVFANLGYILSGLQVTLLIAAGSIALGLCIAAIFVLVRVLNNKFLNAIAVSYIEFFRNTPALVQLVWVFYMVPILFGLKLDALPSCIIALGVSAGAYMAEIFRAGIEDVPRGQTEAAKALGLTRFRIMLLVVIPQALRKVFIPMVNTFVVFFKYSALASVVGVEDIMYKANVVSSTTFRPLEVYTLVAAIYFILCFSMAQAIEWMRRRFQFDQIGAH